MRVSRPSFRYRTAATTHPSTLAFLATPLPDRHSLLSQSLTMTRILLPLALLAALSPLVNAGVKFTSPSAGDKLTAGTAVTVKWEEGGSGPALTDLTTYQLQLIVGGNEGSEQVGYNTGTRGGALRCSNDGK